MTTYDLPRSLRAVGFEFDLLGQTVAGPLTLAQTRQVLSYDGGYWLATLSDISVNTRERVLDYRRMRALLQGGAHQLRVPVCDKGNAPWPGGSPATALGGFDDEDDPGVTPTFSDGGLFASAVISVVLAQAAAAGDTRVVPTVQDAGPIVGGEYFSVGDHLYQVAQVLEDGSWQVAPRLRQALAAGADLNFDDPTCLMTLLTEEQLNLTLHRQRHGTLGMTLMESYEVLD